MLSTKEILEVERIRLERLKATFQRAAPEGVTVLGVEPRDAPFEGKLGGVRTIFEVKILRDKEVYRVRCPLEDKEVYYTTGWWIFERTHSYITEDWSKMLKEFRECLER